jgi:hypothetical protein
MQILSNNIRKPEDGDAGNTWSDGLEYNAEQLNALISTVNNLTIADITKPTQLIAKENWAVDAGGKGYKQSVTITGGLSLDQVDMRFRVTSGTKLNRFINPTIDPTSLTTFDLIVNDSTLDLEILYL